MRVIRHGLIFTKDRRYVNKEWYKPGAFHAEISFWDTPPEVLTVFDRVFVDDWYQVKHHGVDVAWRAVKEGFYLIKGKGKTHEQFRLRCKLGEPADKGG